MKLQSRIDQETRRRALPIRVSLVQKISCQPAPRF